MPGCFTGISINSPISSLILGVPAITMSRLFRNSTHFIDSTGLTYTNFLRNPGPHPFQICNRIPKRWCWLFFLGGASNNNQFGGVFFQLDRHRTVPGFCWEVASKTPKAKALEGSPKSNTDNGPLKPDLWILQGAHPKEWFLAAVTMEEHFLEKTGNNILLRPSDVLILPCSLIDRLWTLQHGSYSIFRKAVGLPCDHKAHLAWLYQKYIFT